MSLATMGQDRRASASLSTDMQLKKKTAQGRTNAESFLHSSRGAVLPEFAVVIGPLLAAFFSLLQLTQIYVANIVLKNATLVACRAASVTQSAGDGFHNPDPNEAAYANVGYLVDAARASMTESDRARFQSITPVPTIDPVSGVVELRLEATFHCTIPLGSKVACGGDFIPLRATAVVPYHGVQYEL